MKYIVLESSHGGLGVERWSENRLHSAPVDQIPLGETIPTISIFYVYIAGLKDNLEQPKNVLYNTGLDV